MENSKQAAYPFYATDNEGRTVQNEGLTKREYFAGLAMQGMCAQFGHGKPEDYAKRAIEYADELLKQLAK
jgi:hypothetical protein